MNNQLPKKLFPFIWHFLKRYKGIVYTSLLLGILAGFWGPTANLITKRIVTILSGNSADQISLLSIWAALMVLSFIVLDNITWRGIDYIKYRYLIDIRNEIVRKTTVTLLGRSYEFFQNNLSGKLANQITTLADTIELILKMVPQFLRTATLLLLSLFTVYTVSPIFFFIQFIWIFTFTVFTIAMSQRLIQLSDTYAQTQADCSGQLVDSITNQNNVRIFANKSYEMGRMDSFFSVTRDAFRKKEWCMLLIDTVQGSLIALMIGFAAYFLIKLYGKGLVHVGDFTLIFGLCGDIGYTMWYTLGQFHEFNQSIGKGKQALQSLIALPEVADVNDAKKLVVSNGAIRFDHVQFHYEKREAIFKNFSVSIASRQKVGLVGYSGSGKSTFVNLLLRLYDIDGGVIMIDGQNIHGVTQESLHRSIAFISQDVSLFHRTIKDNIRYGNVEATDEQVIEAAKKAHAHEFIMMLPNGYDTLVGERGIKLSGGQRQRIAIARALIKNASILILDEATSQLDSVTEQLIQDSLKELMGQRTTIVIAHRLSTLLHMDRILVLDQGTIVADGPHAALLQQGGLYKTLWDTQVGGFLSDQAHAESEVL